MIQASMAWVLSGSLFKDLGQLLYIVEEYNGYPTQGSFLGFRV